MASTLYPNSVPRSINDVVGQRPDIFDWAATRGAQIVTDGVTNGNTTVASASAPFGAGDVGASITIFPAPGSTGATFIGTIVAVTDAQHVVVSGTPSGSLTGAWVMWGTDTASQIQLAHDSIKATSLHSRLEIAAGRYRCDTPIVIDIGNVGLSGLGAVLDFSGYAGVSTTLGTGVSAGTVTITPASMANIVVGTPLLVDAGAAQEWVVPTAITSTTFTAIFANNHLSSAVVSGGAAIVVTGDVVYGDSNNAPNSLRPLAGVQILGSGRNGNAVGIFINNSTTPSGNDNPGPAYCDMQNLIVRSFGVGYLLGSNAYILSHGRFEVNDCGIGIWQPSGFLNTGERISLSDSVLTGCNIGLMVTYQFCDWFLDRCSLDYNIDTSISNKGGGWIFLSQCHIEGGTDNANWFYVSGSDSLIQFTDCEFVTGGGIAIQNYSTFYSNTPQARGGIRLQHCQFFYFINSYGRQFLCDGPGSCIANDIECWSANQITPSNQLNLLGDGGFESSAYLTRYWNISGLNASGAAHSANLPAYSSTSPHSGSQCLLLQTDSGGGSSQIQQWFPICPGDYAYVTLWRNTSNLAASGGIFRIYYQYYDLSGQLITSNHNDYNTNTDGWRLLEFNPSGGPNYGSVGAFTVCAPPGAWRVSILVQLADTTTACQVYVDDMCVCICGKSIGTGASPRMNYGEYLQVNGQFPTNNLIGVDFLTGFQDRTQIFVPGATSTANALIALLGNSRTVGVGDGNILPAATLDIHDTVGANTTVKVTAGASQSSALLTLANNSGSALAQILANGAVLIESGYGSIPSVGSTPGAVDDIAIGAGGSYPHAASIGLGNGTGYSLDFFSSAGGSTQFAGLTDTGNLWSLKWLGAGASSPSNSANGLDIGGDAEISGNLGVASAPDHSGTYPLVVGGHIQCTPYAPNQPVITNATKGMITGQIDIGNSNFVTGTGLTSGGILKWSGSAVTSIPPGITGNVSEVTSGPTGASFVTSINFTAQTYTTATALTGFGIATHAVTNGIVTS